MSTCNIPHVPDILQSSKILSVLTLKLFNNIITAEVLQIVAKSDISENIQDSVFKCEVLFNI